MIETGLARGIGGLGRYDADWAEWRLFLLQERAGEREGETFTPIHDPYMLYYFYS